MPRDSLSYFERREPEPDEDLWERVVEAVSVIKRLPGDRPRGYGGSLPDLGPVDVDFDTWRGPPSAADISRADEVVGWCMKALRPDSDAWACLWACAATATVAYPTGRTGVVASQLSIHRHTVSTRRKSAIRKIRAAKNATR